MPRFPHDRRSPVAQMFFPRLCSKLCVHFLQFFNVCKEAQVLGMIVAVELAHEPLERIHTVHVRSRDTDLLCFPLNYDGRDISLIELQKILA